jgi:hypothetical protein
VSSVAPYLSRCGIRAQAPYARRVALIAGIVSAAIGVLVTLVVGSWMLPIAVIVVGGFVIGALWPLPVRLGNDGLVLPGVGQACFVSFSNVDAVEDDGEATLLHTSDGRRLELVNDQQKKLDELAVGELRALIARCWSDGGTGYVFPPRHEQTLAAWLEMLRASSPERGRLLATVADPAASAPHRAAAAVLLRNRLRTEERAHLAMIAAGAASAELEHALHLVCREDASELEVLSALERFEPGRGWPERFRRVLSRVVETARIDLEPPYRRVRSLIVQARPFDGTRHFTLTPPS